MKTKSLLFLAVLFTATLSAQIPTNGLIAWYPFNGNANDASGNNHNGTVVGATLTNDRFGNPNSAYSFNGGNDTINLNLVETNVMAYSISAWFKTSAGGVILAGDYNSNCITLDIGKQPYDGTNTGRAMYRVDGAGIAIGQWSNATYLDNNWHHVVGTFTATTGAITPSEFKIYVDDSLVSTFPNVSGSATAPLNNTLPVTIGAHRIWTPSVFNGTLDDIRIYDRALDSAEVNALYNENLCYQTITVTDTLIINENLTGFNPIKYNNTIKVYPNPTHTAITIDAGTSGNNNGYTVKILNTLAQVVYTQTISSPTYIINLNTLGSTGTYFVQLYTPSGNMIDVKKIILE